MNANDHQIRNDCLICERCDATHMDPLSTEASAIMGYDKPPSDAVVIRNLERANRKLQERINRINKLTPGLQRLYNLDRIANELEYEADRLEDRNEGYDPEGLRRDALYLRRLEWDLHRLNETVKDRVARNGGTPSDPGHWRGERP